MLARRHKDGELLDSCRSGAKMRLECLVLQCGIGGPSLRRVEREEVGDGLAMPLVIDQP